MNREIFNKLIFPHLKYLSNNCKHV